MKRYTLPSAALGLLLASSLSGFAQSRYGYRSAPGADCEVIERGYGPPPPRALLGRIVRDLRVARDELGRAFYETRDELRRGIHGDTFTATTDRTWGNYDSAYLAEAQRRAAYERRQYALHAQQVRAQWERQLRENKEREYQRIERIERAIPQPAPRSRSRSEEIEIVRPRTEAPPRIESVPQPEPEPQPEAQADPEPRDPVLKEAPQEKRDERGLTEADRRNIPFATKTDKPGFVKSPYPPFELLDVSEFEPGELAMEPDSERMFRIPE